MTSNHRGRGGLVETSLFLRKGKIMAFKPTNLSRFTHSLLLYHATELMHNQEVLKRMKYHRSTWPKMKEKLSHLLLLLFLDVFGVFWANKEALVVDAHVDHSGWTVSTECSITVNLYTYSDRDKSWPIFLMISQWKSSRLIPVTVHTCIISYVHMKPFRNIKRYHPDRQNEPPSLRVPLTFANPLTQTLP